MAPILIVEDDLSNMKVMVTFLDLLGYDHISAASAEEALHILETTVPALALVDIILPGITGVELAQQIHASSRTAQVPLIAVTASADKSYFANAIRKHFDHVIQKPVNLEQLKALIARYVK
ncbi:MAG: response regulator [Chloroflexota bacterium]